MLHFPCRFPSCFSRPTPHPTDTLKPAKKNIRRCRQNNFETLKVTALDLSLFNLRVAKQNLKGVEGVTYVESNAEHMAVENESQDVVTCNFVLSTMPKEAQVNTRECSRGAENKGDACRLLRVRCVCAAGSRENKVHHSLVGTEPSMPETARRVFTTI